MALVPTIFFFQHHMWDAWDLALEICLGNLLKAIHENPNEDVQCLQTLPSLSPFFQEQLTAFQVWLNLGDAERQPPEQLPIVLQVNKIFFIV